MASIHLVITMTFSIAYIQRGWQCWSAFFKELLHQPFVAIWFVCPAWQAIKVASSQLPHIKEFIHYLEDTCLMENSIHSIRIMYTRLMTHIHNIILWLRAASNKHNYMCFVTVHLTRLHQLHPPSARKYSNFGWGCWCSVVISQWIPLLDAVEIYSNNLLHEPFSNECSTTERLPWEFCRNSKMHPSWQKNWLLFCLPCKCYCSETGSYY